jgi:quinol monooxygenase YgiN
MQKAKTSDGPILRLFQVQVKPGHVQELLANFATTSADVVRNEPGNKGYFFGDGVEADDGYVLFASVWENLDAIKQRFGDDWQASYLPPGYEDLIESCSIRHVDLGSGWNVHLGK